MPAFKNLVFPSADKPVKRPAPRVVELPPTAFADTWSGRPRLGKAFKAGLRLVSAADYQDIRVAAAKRTAKTFPAASEEQTAAFHDAFVREVLGRALCQPEDAALPLWEVQQDAVFFSLTPGGVRLLLEHYEALAASTDPTAPEPAAGELRALGEALMSDDPWGSLPTDVAHKARRLAGYLIALTRA